MRRLLSQRQMVTMRLRNRPSLSHLPSRPLQAGPIGLKACPKLLLLQSFRRLRLLHRLLQSKPTHKTPLPHPLGATLPPLRQQRLLLLLLNSRSLRLKLLQSQRQLLYPSRLRNLLRRLQLRLQSLRRLHLLLLRNLLPGRVSSLV